MKLKRNIERWELIQLLINKYNFTKYLEIGVYDGYSLLRIRCKNKIAVDPKFEITFKRKVRTNIMNFTNLFIKYFEQTSDDFFKLNEKFLIKNSKIDIALIDGLHLYEAALKDVLNTLKYINKKGYILMHDCLPPNDGAELATPDIPTPGEILKVNVYTNVWCGNVWKVIVYLRRVYQKELEVYVYDSDNGLGIIKIKEEIINFEIDKNVFDEIDKLKYSDLKSDTVNLVGLTSEFTFY